MTYTSSDGAAARSLVKVRFDPGSTDADSKREPKLLLGLGRLEVLATPGRLLATYRGEDSTFYEASLPERLTASALRAALPRLPLPQIEWCLGTEAQRTGVHPFGLDATLVSTDADGTKHYTSSDGKLAVVPSLHSVHPKRIEWHGEDGSVLRLDISAMDSSDWKSWNLNVEHRQRVATLSELRSRPESTLEGQELRDIGFTTPELATVTLKELVGGDAGTARAAVLVVFEAGKDGAPADGVAADLEAARRAVALALGNLQQGATRANQEQVGVFLVRGLPLDALDIPGLKTSAEALVPAPGSNETKLPIVLNTSSAGWLLNDQLGGSKIATVVLNPQRVVVYSAPLDGRADDAESLASELLKALSRALNVKDSAPVDPSAPAPK